MKTDGLIENKIESALQYAKSCNYSSGDISDLYQTKYYRLAKTLPPKLSKAANFRSFSLERLYR